MSEAAAPAAPVEEVKPVEAPAAEPTPAPEAAPEAAPATTVSHQARHDTSSMSDGRVIGGCSRGAQGRGGQAR